LTDWNAVAPESKCKIIGEPGPFVFKGINSKGELLLQGGVVGRWRNRVVSSNRVVLR